MSYLSFKKTGKFVYLTLFSLVSILLFSLTFTPAYAGSTLTWDNGASGDNYWSSANNWSPDKSPTSGSKVVFDSTTSTNSIVTSTITVDTLDMKSGYSGQVSLWAGLTVNNTTTITGGTFNANGISPTFKGLLKLDGSGAYYLAGSADQVFKGGLEVSSGTFKQESAAIKTTLASNFSDITINGGKFIGSDFDAKILARDFIVSSGTATSTNGYLYLDRDMDLTGGSFNHNSGIVNFTYDETVTSTLTTDGSNLYGLNIGVNVSESSSLELKDTTTLKGEFQASSDTVLDAQNNNISVGSDWKVTDSSFLFKPGTGTVIFNGSGTQQVTSKGENFNKIKVNQQSGSDTVSLQDALTVSSIFTANTGTFDANDNTSTIEGLAKLDNSNANYKAGNKPQNFKNGLRLNAGTYDGESNLSSPLTKITGDNLYFSGGTMTSTNSSTLQIDTSAYVDIPNAGQVNDLFPANILTAANNNPTSTEKVKFNYDTVIGTKQNKTFHFSEGTTISTSDNSNQDFTNLDAENRSMLKNAFETAPGADLSNYQEPSETNCNSIVDGDSDGDNEYASVQTAIDNASSSDMICLRDGTYQEAVGINTPLTLISLNGPKNVTIDGGAAKTAIQVNDVDDVTIKGLTVTNGGDANGESYGVRAELSSNNFTLSDSIIRDIAKEARATGVALAAQFGGTPPTDGTMKNATIKNNKLKNIRATSLTPGDDSNWSGGSQSKSHAFALNGDVRSTTIKNNTIRDIGSTNTDNANAFYFTEDNNAEGPQNFKLRYNDVNKIKTGGNDYNNVIFLGDYANLGDNHEVRFNNLGNDDFSHFLAENLGFSDNSSDDILDTQYNYWGSSTGPTSQQISSGVDTTNFLGTSHSSLKNTISKSLEVKSGALFGVNGNISLQANQDVQTRLKINSGLNGDTLSIYKKTGGNDWQDTDKGCTVSNGECSFQTQSFSQLAAAKDTSTNNNTTDSDDDGGGGGATFSASGSNPPEVESGKSAAVLINGGDSKTTDRNVTLTFNVSNATQVAVSEDQSFSGASFQNYPSDDTMNYTLTNQIGQKTVYVRFQSSDGQIIESNDSIELVSSTDNVACTMQYDPVCGVDGKTYSNACVAKQQNNVDIKHKGECTEQDKNQASSCPLTSNQAYTSDTSNAVYYITKECTKRPFRSSEVYSTYFDSWSDTNLTDQSILDQIQNDNLGFMPWGPNKNIKAGQLFKSVNDSKVYIQQANGNKCWIKNEQVFKALNYSFANVWDIHSGYIEQTPSCNSPIDYTNRHPNYTLIKYPNNNDVYMLQPNENGTQVKRLIENMQVFKEMSLSRKDIITINKNETYPTGNPLSSDNNSKDQIEVAYTFTKYLKRGSKGQQVINLQKTLKDMGYYKGKINGYYDLETVNAVMDFQEDHGMERVGVIGPSTRETLNNM